MLSPQRLAASAAYVSGADVAGADDVAEAFLVGAAFFAVVPIGTDVPTSFAHLHLMVMQLGNMYPHIRTDSPREVKHFRFTARLSSMFLVLVLLASTSCSDREATERRRNVRPPEPGTPAKASDVQGIYRTVHQGLLQLRGDGEFVMIIPGEGPSAGTYTLSDGTFTVRTDACGEEVGRYRVTATGPQRAGEAALHFSPVFDNCGVRTRYLTIDPWIYADS
jgi:hypothetical protein